jgi:hypothetical protein
VKQGVGASQERLCRGRHRFDHGRTTPRRDHRAWQYVSYARLVDRVDRVGSWRIGLAVFASIALVVGIALGVLLFFDAVAPYPSCFPNCLPDDPWWDWGEPVISPLLVTLGGMALAVRSRLHRIEDLPRGHRAGLVTTVAIAVPLIGAGCYCLLFVMLLVTVVSASCNAHGC